MKITKVGQSEREYYTNGKERAYITLNSERGFRVIKNCRVIAEYKTYLGAKKYLARHGFIAE